MAVGCAGAPARAGSEAVPAPDPAPVAAVPSSGAAGAALRAPVSALLQPGDIVRMAIWREPDLSGDFRIDETGVAVLPKVGPQRIGQESGEAFRERIVTEYRRYLLNPSIDVVFLRRIPISGAVRSPGLYNVDLTVSVAEALALAGGVTEQGNPDRVFIVRTGSRTRVVAERGAAIASLPLGSGDQLYVGQRSWLIRNAGVVAGIASSITGLALILRAR